MIKYKHGDIVEALIKTTDIDVCFHQANCFCNLGAGIAKQLAAVFPALVDVDDTTSVGDKNKLGTFTYAEFYQSHQFRIYNLYGQWAFRYGLIYKWIDGVKHQFTIPEEYDENGLKPMTSLPHLRQAIEGMINHVCGVKHDLRFATVKIGAGRGGADWNSQVYPMLEELFDGLDLTVYRF